VSYLDVIHPHVPLEVVVASVKIYNQYGAQNLDHFALVGKKLPYHCNIAPEGTGFRHDVVLLIIPYLCPTDSEL